MEVISTKSLSHAYGSKKVFENLQFSVQKGSITGLLGKNGTGKTTIINILNGYLNATGGKAYLMGEDSNNLSIRVKQKLGFLIEGHIQYDFMTIGQIEKFYAPFYPGWDKKRFFELVDIMGLNHRHKISKMSCGQRSQVALGLIFAQDPELIILDDFSMGLDPGYRRLFIDYLKHYVQEKETTVFLTSHIVQDMEKLISDVIILHNQRILLQKPLNDFMQTVNMFVLPKEHFKMSMMDELPDMLNIEILSDEVQFYSEMELGKMKYQLEKYNINPALVQQRKITLEDAFVGITGRY